MPDREGLEEQRKQEKRDEILMDTMTQIADRLNDMAIRLDVQTNSTSEIMDSLLRELVGRQCVIYMKSGKIIEGITLKAFDKSTLLCYGYFDVGLLSPVYSEIGIDRRDVSMVTQFWCKSAIYRQIRRIKRRCDGTA